MLFLVKDGDYSKSQLHVCIPLLSLWIITLMTKSSMKWVDLSLQRGIAEYKE